MNYLSEKTDLCFIVLSKIETIEIVKMNVKTNPFISFAHKSNNEFLCRKRLVLEKGFNRRGFVGG